MSTWLSSSLSSALHHLAGSQGTAITTVTDDVQPDAELSVESNQPLPTLKNDLERCELPDCRAGRPL